MGPADGRPYLGVVRVEGLEIVLANLDDGSWAAFDNDCTHEECPLSEGDLDGERIVCYCHSSVFNVRTGEVLEGPADEPIGVYEVRVDGGELLLRVGP